jgi:hypothetical protein
MWSVANFVNVRSGKRRTLGNILSRGPPPQKQNSPLGITVPKGPSDSRSGILPTGTAAPLPGQSPGNAVQPGETLPLIGGRSQGESGRGSGTWDGERRSWGAGEHGGGDVTGPRKKVPAFNAEAPSADVEGTWACLLRFRCYCCRIASLDTVIIMGDVVSQVEYPILSAAGQRDRLVGWAWVRPCEARACRYPRCASGPGSRTGSKEARCEAFTPPRGVVRVRDRERHPSPLSWNVGSVQQT